MEYNQNFEYCFSLKNIEGKYYNFENKRYNIIFFFFNVN